MVEIGDGKEDEVEVVELLSEETGESKEKGCKTKREISF